MSGRVVAVVIAALVGLGACGTQPGGGTAAPATEPPRTDPTIVGFITEVMPFEPVTTDCVEPERDADPDSSVSSDDPPVCTDPDTAPLGTVLVEEDPTASEGDNKISLTVDTDTILLSETSGSNVSLSLADLTEGMTVTAWADGAVAESYPAQATAAAIVVRPS
jgi:Protein of unknown function (DUF3221)